MVHSRDFVSSIALKEEPESPGTLRKKAQEKRKKAMESKEPVDVKKMMTGVVFLARFIHIHVDTENGAGFLLLRALVFGESSSIVFFQSTKTDT